jgi:uncharacterized damage-inducible protein DinB
MTIADEFRRLFEYEKDAHAKTIASLRDAAPSHAHHADFRQALNLAEHLAAARLIWLGRFGKCDAAPTTWFPNTAATVDDVEALFARMHKLWTAYLGQVDEAELAREFEYRSLTDEGRFRDFVGDILYQMFGHSFYHRGQIALLLRRMGATPATTDLVYWSRRPV